MKAFDVKKTVAICLLMGVCAMGSNPVGYAENIDYENHWAKESIEKALEAGILKGYLDGSVRPDNTVTRAEFFSMVNNAFHYSESKEITFADVKDYMWYAPIIKRAVAAGYIEKADGYVRPDDMITREEVATYLCLVKALDRPSLTSNVTDLSQASPKAKVSILSILESGIMKGTPEQKFLPKAKIKRAEALTAIMNAVAYDSGNLTFLDPKVYGSETVTQLLHGSVLVRSKDVTLRSMVIAKDLVIGKEVGAGTVTLKNTVVKGTIYVYGGGVIILDSVTANHIVVENEIGSVNIEARGETVVERTTVSTDVILTEPRASLSKDGFQTVVVKDSRVDDLNLNIPGAKLSVLQIDSKGILVLTDSLTEIKELNIYGENTKVRGSGHIIKAYIKGNGIIFENRPFEWDVHPGVKLPTVTNP